MAGSLFQLLNVLSKVRCTVASNAGRGGFGGLIRKRVEVMRERGGVLHYLLVLKIIT